MKELFQQIKRTFFPRWDRQGEWVFEEHEDLNGAHGYCRPKEKSIQITVGEKLGVQLEMLLIHEICHAVASCSHGNPWLTRMEKAAVKADEVGKAELATAIWEEIERCKTHGVNYTAPVFYDLIREWVLENPEVTEDEMLTAVGREIGLSYDEVTKGYPRAQRVFRSAQREVERYRKAEEKGREMLGVQESS
jgi:hypothetical protein